MKNILHIAALGISMIAGGALADETGTGVADLQVVDARQDRPLEGFIWYPTAQTEGKEAMHGNAVWQGIHAIPDATPQAGPHPLVVLSHGIYGNAMNQSWLADALAQAGFVVAAVHHPGSSTWLRDPDHARQLWDRPGDVSRVIDHLLADPHTRAFIDPDRIYMAGHSLGGMTAVALAGGRFDVEKVDRMCADGSQDLICSIIERWQLAKTPQDKQAMQADLSDPRIKGFAMFDLGATQTFSPASLAAIDRPVLIIGAPKDVSGMNLDLESRALKAALPAGNVTYLEPAGLSHFDFLGLCTPGAMEILAAEEPGDEVICLEGGPERLQDHALIRDAVLAAFQ